MSPTSQAVDGARVPTRVGLASPCCRADDDLVALEHAHRGGVGLEQLHGVLHRLVEDVVRVELAREIAAGPREPLGQVPRAALALVEVAALERGTRGRRHLRRQLELLVLEGALSLEEHEHEPCSFAARLLERDCEEGVPVRGRRRGADAVAEAVVLGEPPRCEHFPAAGTRGQLRRVILKVSGESLRQLVRAGELEPGAGRPEHRSRVAAERLRGGLRDSVERLPLRERLAQHSRDPVEAALDLRLPRALLVGLGVP